MQMAEGLLAMSYGQRRIMVGVPALLPLVLCDKGDTDAGA